MGNGEAIRAGWCTRQGLWGCWDEAGVEGGQVAGVLGRDDSGRDGVGLVYTSGVV